MKGRRNAPKTSQTQRQVVLGLAALFLGASLLGADVSGEEGYWWSDTSIGADSPYWWTLSDQVPPEELRRQLTRREEHQARYLVSGAQDASPSDAEAVVAHLDGATHPELIPAWWAWSVFGGRYLDNPDGGRGRLLTEMHDAGLSLSSIHVVLAYRDEYRDDRSEAQGDAETRRSTAQRLLELAVRVEGPHLLEQDPLDTSAIARATGLDPTEVDSVLGDAWRDERPQVALSSFQDLRSDLDNRDWRQFMAYLRTHVAPGMSLTTLVGEIAPGQPVSSGPVMQVDSYDFDVTDNDGAPGGSSTVEQTLKARYVGKFGVLPHKYVLARCFINTLHRVGREGLMQLNPSLPGTLREFNDHILVPPDSNREIECAQAPMDIPNCIPDGVTPNEVFGWGLATTSQHLLFHNGQHQVVRRSGPTPEVLECGPKFTLDGQISFPPGNHTVGLNILVWDAEGNMLATQVEVLSGSGSSPFSIGALTDGHSYQIVRKPGFSFSTITCDFSPNASGTISGSSVSGITIDCQCTNPPQCGIGLLWEVSGTIGGLPATQSVRLRATAETPDGDNFHVEIEENGSFEGSPVPFSFGHNFPEGTAFEVTVEQVMGESLCNIPSGRTGQVIGADFTGVRVECQTAGHGGVSRRRPFLDEEPPGAPPPSSGGGLVCPPQEPGTCTGGQLVPCPPDVQPHPSPPGGPPPVTLLCDTCDSEAPPCFFPDSGESGPDLEANIVGVPSTGPTVAQTPDELLRFEVEASDSSPLHSVMLGIDGVYHSHRIATGGSPFHAEWPGLDTSALSEGEHTLNVVGYALQGPLAGVTLLDVPFTVDRQAPPSCPAPAVSIVSPADGAILSGLVEVQLHAVASTGSIAAVTLFDAATGSQLGVDGSAPYSIPWDLQTLSGTATVYATATNSCGSTGRSADVQIVVDDGPNHKPVAVDDKGTTLIDSSVDLIVTANDGDPDGDAVYVVPNGFVTRPALHGVVTRLSPDVLRYTPDAGWVGTDSFEYEIGDGQGLRDRADVHVHVGLPQATTVLADDAWVNGTAGAENTNYGAESWLRLRWVGSGHGHHTYLKFEASDVNGPVVTARLRVRTRAGHIPALALYELPNTVALNTAWEEDTITWANAPLEDAVLREELLGLAPWTWYEFDVSSFVTGNGTYVMGLASSSSDLGMTLYSKESADPPELVITYEP